MGIFSVILTGCGKEPDHNTEISSDAVTESMEYVVIEKIENAEEIPVGKLTEELVRNSAVTDSKYFKYEVVGDGIRITEYVGKEEMVHIPGKIDGKTVTEIALYVFANDSIVRGVYLPDTVVVCNDVFTNNSCIEVVICEGLEEAIHCFANCANLHTVVFGKNLKKIENYAFYACPMLKSLNISSSLNEIIEEPAGTIFWASDNLTIIGESGSVIESYCKEHGINFQTK